MKPILFIDVDGVLNPHSKPRFLKPLGFKKYRIWDDEINRCDRYTVWLNKLHGEWLSSLTDLVDLAWATTWNDRANDAIAGRIGLPRLPVAHARPRVGMLAEKTRSIIDMAGSRPFAWIDDCISTEDINNLRGYTKHLIKPESYHGLQMHHITSIRLWAEQCQ